MKRLIIIIALFVSIASYAEKRAELIVSESRIGKSVTVFFDDGSDNTKRVKNEKGKKFKSPVAAVNHFIAKGWEVKEMNITSLNLDQSLRIYVLVKQEE